MKTLAVIGSLVAIAVLAAPQSSADLRRAFEQHRACEDVACLKAQNAQLRKRIERINRRSARLERQRNDLRRTLNHRPDVVEAIKLAAVVYGVSSRWMLSRGSCESTGGHGHNPRAVNPSSKASGEFQFLWPTWRSTPFAAFSPFSPYANALAAGWMMGPAHRAGEWDCP